VLHVVGGVAALGVSIALIASHGGPHSPGTGLIVVSRRVLIGGGLALIYVVAGLGFGGLAAGLWRGASEAGAMRLGVGLALMLTISFVLGVLGAMAMAMATAIAVLVLGVAVFVWTGARSKGAWRARRVSPWLALWGVPLAVLVVAASNPTGWLWRSEAHGYDAMSYHLQLPQEWLASGGIKSFEHNIYSFLPGYVESAFFHLAVATGAPAPGGDEWPSGLLAEGGWRAFAPKMLHALMTLCAAWLARRATLRGIDLSAGEHEGGDEPGGAGLGRDAAGWLAGALLLATPWSVVVGSMAYNEMAVVCLGLAGLIATMETGIGPWRRGALAGGLVGVACGAKPTALLFVGLPVGVALVALSGAPRRVAAACFSGGVVGVAALAPWLGRNWVGAGNPVFPHLTGVFGTGHWSSAQVERYQGAHFFDGTVMERLGRLVVPIGEASRGMTHTQWGVLFAAVAGGLVVTLARARTRRLGVVLGIGLAAQVLAWLIATHLQSRFLIPLMVTGVPLVGLGAWGLGARWGALGAWPLAGVVVAQTVISIIVLAGQRPDEHGRGEPNWLLVPGTRWYTGELMRREIAEAPVPRARRALVERLGPTQYVNLIVPRDATVYLVGSATPLYYREPVVYHTTWDASPLGEAIEASPGDPSAWTESLRGRGIELALIDFGELTRLIERDGWYDPRVTPERVSSWARSLGTPARVWDGGRLALFDLHEAERDDE